MKTCAQCGGAVDVDLMVSRRETCPFCGAGLHVCLNCRFHERARHNECSEPKAEHQRSREKINFCDYFQYREGGASTKAGESGEKADAYKKLDDLFGGKG
jgi:hypothetical protein